MDYFQTEILAELRNLVTATKEQTQAARQLLEGLSQQVAILSEPETQTEFMDRMQRNNFYQSGKH